LPLGKRTNKSEGSLALMLASLRRIQHHTVSINDNQPVSGVSALTREQVGAFAALKVRKPAEGHQLSLL
ncbi:MAG: hypothetical protein EBV01_15185, partial [Betaproteobacteria bacterium]|nr:hypothetical protein [Betaproteobacteria bacterium]